MSYRYDIDYIYHVKVLIYAVDIKRSIEHYLDYDVIVSSYLVNIVNPIERYIKEYVEINYNFRNFFNAQTLYERETMVLMAEDFIECPYRFRIFLEIVNNLPEYELTFGEKYINIRNIYIHTFLSTHAD